MNAIPIEVIFNEIIGISFWSILKVVVVFALFLYVLFAVVVVKQINMMIETLTTQLELLFRLISVIHLAGAIFIFILAIIVL
ncbi:MAG: hypothetical protein Q7S03_01985 [bacterium]|nr:hypothetical protein [bacterium]